MAMGRKPKPTHLKLVTGNPGRRPLPAVEAQAVPALPSPPPHLSDDAKLEWGRVSEELYKIGLLSSVDRASLAAYCQAYGRWARIEAVLGAFVLLLLLGEGSVVSVIKRLLGG